MICAPIHTGSRFLAETLAHVDCQAQNIGSFGFQALADPSSQVSIASTGLLTLFIAAFGIRMLMGYWPGRRDAFDVVLRIGIVLTLATGWPAWRSVGYDLILDAPTQLGEAVAVNAGLPSTHDLRSRLQNADAGLVVLTAYGTGRLPGSDLREEFRGMALQDETGFGWGRLIFLLGAIGPQAIVRLGAGVLLALTPVFAFFLLLGSAQSLFDGWIRGLAFTAFGSLSLSIVSAVMLGLFEPWIAEVAGQRAAGMFAPGAATEMAALSLVFLVVSYGVLLLTARVTFLPWFTTRLDHVRGLIRDVERASPIEVRRSANESLAAAPADRAHVIASSVAKSVRREDLETAGVRSGGHLARSSGYGAPDPTASTREFAAGANLGSSYRRTHPRTTSARRQRDALP